MNLIEYVSNHVERGECKCGQCIDRGDKPDPNGHTADLEFFTVAARDNPTKDEFVRLVREHRGAFCECDPLDVKEHGYMELGGWIGDQGVALKMMGLGKLLGAWELLTPTSIFGRDIPAEKRMELAGRGLVAIQARKPFPDAIGIGGRGK